MATIAVSIAGGDPAEVELLGCRWVVGR